MRPSYETKNDRDHEEEVIGKLMTAWGCGASRAPRKYAVDWALERGGQVYAMAEVKYRSKSYPTYIMSLSKFVTMCIHSTTSGLPYLLIVSWPEGGKRVIRYTRIDRKAHTGVILGGRKDRGDPDDIEPMVEIPIEKFSLLREA